MSQFSKKCEKSRLLGECELQRKQQRKKVNQKNKICSSLCFYT